MLHASLLRYSFFVLGLLSLAHVEGSIRIGAFNVQTFGTKKFGNETLMYYIEEILRRYDVVLVQEIRDASGVVIPGVLARLNKEENGLWDVKYSERLGRTSYKEQYAYYFRTDKLTVLSEYQYDDGPDDGTDLFMREPYGVLFQPVYDIGVDKFGLLGIHASPDFVVKELNGLEEVYTAAVQYWDTEDIMMMGDFNAACSYLSGNELTSLSIRKNGFEWLIGDDIDTTQGATHCAYDRIVAAGTELLMHTKPLSAKTFQFDKAFQLDSALARKVSDHYPVEVVLESAQVSYNGASRTRLEL